MQRIFDLAIDSALELPDLPEHHVDQPDILIDVDPVTPACIDNISQWLHRQERADGTFSHGWFKRGESYVFRYSGAGEISADLSAGSVTVSVDPATNPGLLRHLLVDQVLPLLVADMGNLVLHGSTVAWGDRCAVFIGPSGAGKSTLGTALAQSGQVLSGDDAVLLRHTQGATDCIASYRGARLRQDSAKHLRPPGFGQGFEPAIGKYRFRPQPADRENLDCVLSAIFLLETTPHQPCAQLRLEPLGPAEMFRALATNAFNMDLSSKMRLSRHCQRVSAIVDSQPAAYRLTYAHHYDNLRTVADAVDSLMRQIIGDIRKPCIGQ